MAIQFRPHGDGLCGIVLCAGGRWVKLQGVNSNVGRGNWGEKILVPFRQGQGNDSQIIDWKYLSLNFDFLTCFLSTLVDEFPINRFLKLKTNKLLFFFQNLPWFFPSSWDDWIGSWGKRRLRIDSEFLIICCLGIPSSVIQTTLEDRISPKLDGWGTNFRVDLGQITACA